MSVLLAAYLAWGFMAGSYALPRAVLMASLAEDESAQERW